jgi:hypothetical protein
VLTFIERGLLSSCLSASIGSSFVPALMRVSIQNCPATEPIVTMTGLDSIIRILDRLVWRLLGSRVAEYLLIILCSASRVNQEAVVCLFLSLSRNSLFAVA